MRATHTDLNSPDPGAKPFFYGYWADTTLTSAVWKPLPITTVAFKQKGMLLSGGGCQVPISGIYHVGAFARSDSSGVAGACYAHMLLQVNGADLAYSLTNNGFVSGTEFAYADHQLWIPTPLNAGDIVTVLAFQNALAGTFYGAGWPGTGLRMMYDSPWTEEP